MRGRTVRSPERVAEAMRLRREGLKYREIAGVMGVSLSAAQEWVSDPDGEKRAARKAGYQGSCVDCGEPTDGSDPRMPAERCRLCTGQHIRKLTREWILRSFEEWADLFGVPPTAADWNPALAISQGQQWKAERHRATGRPWPCQSTVCNHFGSWSAGVATAGFDPTPSGHYGRDGEDPATVEETVRLYRSGLSLDKVGERMGITGVGVRSRLIKVGEPWRPAAGATT